MTVLITGAAGFIGFHLASLLLDQGRQVIGVDSHNDYYDPALKAAREAKLITRPGYVPVRGKVEDPGLMAGLFATHRPRIVVHLAAQAGVRYSIQNPRAYMEANMMGSFELLEAARAHPPQHLLMASSSSVYGANTQMPYRETDKVDLQLSVYASTKKSNEAIAHSYSHLFGLPISMFRFFTVYGPWGRPDMAPYLFTSALFEGRPIKVFNHGNMRRDFTFVGDLVRALRLLMDVAPQRPADGTVPDGDSLSPVAPWRVVNIGNGNPVELMDFIRALESASGHEAVLNMMPMQPGDVPATWADTALLRRLTAYAPQTSVTDGTRAYVEWFRGYYSAGSGV
ncbi:NAD-dependent epimerase/dehydratase family protein [Paracoccus sp. (in: a-proteobacteria)]|uniref:NAD-dependent epimerase/dehydratase family protein n=1 Tax=Paracoccus sp. TaxID=267 RepID=UPI003A8BB9E9